MEYAILAAVIIALSGAVLSLIFWSMYAAERAKVEPLRTELGATQAAYKAAVATAAEKEERLEVVIAGLKKEIGTIEATLQTCRDPAVVRDRLRGLLGAVQPSVPVPGKPAGYGVGPYGGTPKP